MKLRELLRAPDEPLGAGTRIREPARAHGGRGRLVGPRGPQHGELVDLLRPARALPGERVEEFQVALAGQEAHGRIDELGQAGPGPGQVGGPLRVVGAPDPPQLEVVDRRREESTHWVAPRHGLHGNTTGR